ncbi:Sel1l2, partial [Symbiodinium microadriaticum]
MDDHNDEADWLPAYEAYIMEQGSFLPELAGPNLQRAVLQLQDIAMPFVRQVYKCETCVPCTSFVRRYLQKERVRVPAHFDVTAYATVIVPLTPALNYSGGFFVQPTAHVDSRLFVPLQLGDIAVHDFTLNHGIEVLDGGRYSLVLWVSEEHASCRLSKTPWHAQRALEGDAVAQHILGMMFGQGNGAPQDDARALEWTVRAAEGGLANAQFSAGTMYFEGQGTPVDLNRSFF